ncbi:MAG: hypothetical protein R3F56_22990 [Planctomycetota bacterium]
MHSIDPTNPRVTGPVAAEPAGVAAPTNPTFQRLLDSLESLARSPTPAVGDAESLQHALRRAEDDFVVAMDLRRRLEEAVRGSR